MTHSVAAAVWGIFAIVVFSGAALLAWPAYTPTRLLVARWHGLASLVLLVPLGLLLFLHLRRRLAWHTWVVGASGSFLWFGSFLTGFSPPWTKWVLGVHGLFLVLYFYVSFRGLTKWGTLTGALTAAALCILVPTGLVLVKGMFRFNIEGVGSMGLYEGHRWSAILMGVGVLWHGVVFPLVHFQRQRALNQPRILASTASVIVFGLSLLAAAKPGDTGGGKALLVDGPADVPPMHRLNPEWCMKCHDRLYPQWESSVHRFSAVNLAYRRVVREFAKAKGADATNFCARCHNPVLGYAGRPDPAAAGNADDISRQGVSCVVCHLMNEVPDSPANGKFSLATDPGYVIPGGLEAPRSGNLLEAQISADTRPHRRSMVHYPEGDSRRCQSCHRVRLEGLQPDSDRVTIEDVVTSWEAGPYGKMQNSCFYCHMMEIAPEHDFLAMVGAGVPPNHHVPGLQTALAATVEKPLENALAGRNDEFVLFWLGGRFSLTPAQGLIHAMHTLHDLSPQTPHFEYGLPLEVRLSISPGGEEDAAELVIETRNVRSGHEFPAGSHDLNEVWLEVKEESAAGEALYFSGFVDLEGRIDPAAVRLGGRETDSDGRPIQLHRIWEIRSIDDVAVIRPGETRRDRILLPHPAGGSRITARWRYRRYNPDFTEWALGIPVREVPIETLGSGEWVVP